MKINDLLLGVDCACGKHHSCDVEKVYIENDAMKHLTLLCESYDNILLVADGNTYAAAGEKTEKYLDGKNITRVLFPGETVLIPNEEAIDRVTAETSGIDLIIGIGSGVIQDLCKYVSHTENIPYFIVATAPSMDGYASTGAAMITDGMKVTYSAGVPKAIIADTAVLAGAPLEMIKAGYGDIVGKYSALNDWKLSHLVNDEYFCQYIYDLTMDMVDKTLALADGLLKRSEESVKVLMEALVIVGIAMSFAGSSRPASGSEHHLSHFFEITGIINGENYLPHGIDVAYSTVVTAALREKIVNTPFPSVGYNEDRTAYENTMKRVYKSVADGCIALQDKIGNYKAERMPIYLEKECEIKNILSEVPTAKQIEKMLSAVSISMSQFDEHYSKAKQNDAIKYAKDLKDRYTVLWLYYTLFGAEC